jgi:HPt (histidine-containing phosphotransfer) domain-containing protein
VTDELAGVEALDRNDLEERFDGAIELSVDLIELFLEDAPRRVREMVDCHDSGDAETLRRLAHTLKGSAASVSAMRIRTVAARLESAAVEGFSDETARLVAALSGELDVLRESVSDLID